MSKNLLTADEVVALEMNPYVKKVTERSVIFTTEFKVLVYERIKNGENIGKVLDSIGISSASLGKSRLNGIRGKLYKDAIRPEGFAIKKSERQEKNYEEKLENRIKKLERELLRAEQTIEFLKKTQKLDMMAQIEQRQVQVKSICL